MATAQVIFRDKNGRFVPAKDRYGKRVETAWRKLPRRRKYVLIYDRFETHGDNLSPEYLAEVLTKPQFESLPDVLVLIKSFTSNEKYRLWDIAKKIDKMKNIRGKLLELEVMVQDGKYIRKEKMNYAISYEGPANYAIYESLVRFLAKKGVVTHDRNDPLFNRLINHATDYGQALFRFLSMLIRKKKKRKVSNRQVTIKQINVSEVS